MGGAGCRDGGPRVFTGYVKGHTFAVIFQIAMLVTSNGAQAEQAAAGGRDCGVSAVWWVGTATAA